ncbi:DNA polymerase III subunit gamma/tau [Bacteroidales bacterium OttesenSCG-928-J19]|nr:DNA polymerase III subunit gamma/tau [Bacteroidales bacterium OttesenSCG-928-J19]
MDNYIVSARKYRPGTFHSVIGQKSLTTTLKNAIVNNKLAHAYLFCGPRGVGKTTCARIFAKSINCLNPKADGEPCNECESCQSFNENRSLNIHELDAASNNSVEDIRSLTDQVRIPPQLGKYKVYIIDEVHMLSTAAFNAFLKTLEEPPHYAIFILATTEKHKILPTILSRCQIYDFSRININDIVDYLEYVAGQEGATAEREALNVIAQKADGGMRDALSIFDQVVSFSQGNVTYKAVIENLNVLDYEYYFNLTGAILKNDVSKSLLLLNEILSKGFDGQHFVSGLADFFRDVMVCKDPQTIVLFEVGDTIKQKYLAVAQACPTPFLYKALDMSVQCDLDYRVSKNKRLLVELLLVRLCQLTLPLDSEAEKKKTIISPITAPKEKESTPSQQPVSQQPEAPVSSPASEPPVTVYTAPKESGTKPQGASSAPKRASLKGLLNKTETEEVIVQEQQENILDKPFDDASLIRVWKEFAEKQDDDHLKNTMLNFLPRKEDDSQVLIELSNPAQENRLREAFPDLRLFLAQKLGNNQIQFEVRLNEKPASESRPFLPHEKYQYMLTKNPVLNGLVKEFNLRLD